MRYPLPRQSNMAERESDIWLSHMVVWSPFFPERLNFMRIWIKTSYTCLLKSWWVRYSSKKSKPWNGWKSFPLEGQRVPIFLSRSAVRRTNEPQWSDWYWADVLAKGYVEDWTNMELDLQPRFAGAFWSPHKATFTDHSFACCLCVCRKEKRGCHQIPHVPWKNHHLPWRNLSMNSLEGLVCQHKRRPLRYLPISKYTKMENQGWWPRSQRQTSPPSCPHCR